MVRPVKYTVYTDGSASTLASKAGGFAAAIHRDGKQQKIVWGGWHETTVGKMELWAIIWALEFIQAQPDAQDCVVHVFCDRKDVVMSASGRSGRRRNLEEWQAFDRAARNLNLNITHARRNALPEQAACDKLSGRIRLSVEQHPGRRFDYRTDLIPTIP